MKTLDRALIALLTLGIWVLAGLSFLAPDPVFSQSGFDRREIRLAITNCRVDGPVSNGYLNATILCR